MYDPRQHQHQFRGRGGRGGPGVYPHQPQQYKQQEQQHYYYHHHHEQFEYHHEAPSSYPRRAPHSGAPAAAGGRSGTPPWRRRSFDLDDPLAAQQAGGGGGGGGAPPSFSEELAGKPRGGSMQVRNDYSQHFLETGERPQNFIRDATVDEGFAAYPKLARLLAAKDAMVESRRTPPMQVRADLRTFDLRSLGTRFDVIYMDPPWEEYARRAAPFVVAAGPGKGGGGGCDGSQDLDASVWRYGELQALPIEEIADTPSFIFLWCGSGGRVTEDVEHGPLHVDDGRRLLAKWGYRRCEEVCWIKTNTEAAGSSSSPQKQPDLPTSTTSLLVRTKEHCLMGIKGSVRRNRDGHLLHCNVHTDIIVAEQPTDPLSLRKPVEMYRIMEHFAMGRRRIELFGCPHNVRPGWVTVGNQLHGTTYDKAQYLAWMREPGVNPDGTPCPGHLLGSTPLIEELRPKTPPREVAAATATAIGATGPRAAALALGGGGGGVPGSPPVSPRGRPMAAAIPVRGPFQSPHPGSMAPMRARGGGGGGSGGGGGVDGGMEATWYGGQQYHKHQQAYGAWQESEHAEAAAAYNYYQQHQQQQQYGGEEQCAEAEEYYDGGPGDGGGGFDYYSQHSGGY